MADPYAPPIIERDLPHFHRSPPVLESVRVATTANITIATGLNVGDVVDGVTLALYDRVLVKDQSTGSQNGIIVVGATPSRAYDLSTDDPAFGFLVYVREGTVNAGRIYRSTNTSTPTIDTTALTFAQITATAGAVALDDLTDVAITTPAELQFLRYVGSTWINAAPPQPLVEDDGAGSFAFVFETNGEVIWE